MFNLIGSGLINSRKKQQSSTIPDNVLLFLRGTDSVTLDSSNVSKTIAVEQGTPAISSTQFKFSEYGTSLYIPSGAALSVPISELNLTTDFTVWTMEAWIYTVTDSGVSGGLIFGTYNQANNQSSRYLFTTKRYPTDATFATYSMPIGQWNYWKSVRNGNNYKLIVNGSLITERSFTAATSIDNKNWIGRSVGDNNIDSWRLDAYLQDFIITGNVADDSLVIPTSPKYL